MSKVIDPILLEDFRTVAEIAATMAGFAAIVGAIERTRGSGVSIVRTSTFFALLFCTLPLIILALLPSWLHNVLDFRTLGLAFLFRWMARGSGISSYPVFPDWNH